MGRPILAVVAALFVLALPLSANGLESGATCDDDEDSLEQLARDHYAERLIGRAEYLAARQALEERIEATRSQLRRQQSTATIADLPSGGDAVRIAWRENDLAWRRALVGTVLERMVLHPAVKGRNFFDPERVELIWRA